MPLGTFLGSFQGFLINLISALVVFFIGRILIKYLLKLLARILDRRNLDQSLHAFILSIVRISLIVLLALICAGMLRINITPVITALGAVGLAVSLAIKDSLSNLAGGVFILLTKPFVSGDFVEIGSAAGVVRKIDLLHCIIDTPDNKEIYFPNGSISGSVITNYSSAPQRRVDLNFSVAYDADWEQAKKIAQRTAAAHPMVLQNPEPPMVRVLSYEDSSVKLVCRSWVDSANYWNVYFDLTEQVREALDQAGISAPFPQVEIRSNPSAEGSAADRK